MEYHDGGSLASQLRGEPQPAAKAARMTQTLAAAMQAAHVQGIRQEFAETNSRIGKLCILLGELMEASEAISKAIQVQRELVKELAEIKRKALACHRSQDPEAIWKVHEAMARQRGSECGITLAEAYALVCPRRDLPTLSLSFLNRKK